MNPNPLLKKLGYADDDRLVILHADDIGMCQASLTAFMDLWEFGTLSSGAVMVPCPWFPAAAQLCRQHPEFDMGVHATLNCEWESYRWGPLSTRDPASGLIDDQGYFYQSPQDTRRNANPRAVAVEIEFQVKRALDAGIDVTHLDSHMLTTVSPEFIEPYIHTALQYRIPNMLIRPEFLDMQNAQGESGEQEALRTALTSAAALHVALLDGIAGMPLDEPGDQLETAQYLLNQVSPGITHFVLHPAVDTPELRAIAPDWPSRVANYRTFMSEQLKTFIRSSGLQVIGYRQIREIMRATQVM